MYKAKENIFSELINLTEPKLYIFVELFMTGDF